MGFDAQFCGGIIEGVKEFPNDATDLDIKAAFPSIMGMEYDENCYYEIIGGVKK